MTENNAVPINGQDTWPELNPLNNPQLPNLNIEGLPPWLSNYIKHEAQFIQTPIELVTMFVLSSTSIACARVAEVQVKEGYSEPLNLWMIAALSSGHRKSAVLHDVTKPLLEWEMSQHKNVCEQNSATESERELINQTITDLKAKARKTDNSQQAQDIAQEIAELKNNTPQEKPEPRLFTTDCTVEKLATLLYENDERIAWLSSEGGLFDILQGNYSSGKINIDTILSGYSGDATRIDRKTSKSIRLNKPLISVGLSPQPITLENLARGNSFQGRGLFARFLYLLPPSVLGQRKANPSPVPEHIRQDYHSGITTMLNWAPSESASMIINPTEGAQAQFNAFFDEIETKLKPDRCNPAMESWYGKAPGQMIRLAGVIHCAKHVHGEPWKAGITPETIHSSIQLMAVFEAHAQHALTLMGVDDVHHTACAIWEKLQHRKCKPTSLSDLRELIRKRKGATKVFELSINLLKIRGYIKLVKRPKGKGKPLSDMVYVRPELISEGR
jgi:hypothetical protein